MSGKLKIILFGLILLVFPVSSLAHSQNDTSDKVGVAESTTRIFLPLVYKEWPRISPFGVEVIRYLLPDSASLKRVESLGGQWIRMNYKISWRSLQPIENGPIKWSLLANFEAELLQLSSAGFTPIVIVDDYPEWAVIPTTRANGQVVLSSCSAIRADKFSAFANFMQKLVLRYGDSPYNVKNWELGNEPDIDPSLVPIDSHYGCWGDKDDPFYGGGHYGEMLKVVAPVMRAADKNTKIWIGGLLLDAPNTNVVNSGGRPELFFEGVLQAGAGSAFDVLPYHAYPAYMGTRADADTNPTSKWAALGGFVVGKARYLRSIMATYGIDKPLFMNEYSLTCPENVSYCTTPGQPFFQAQADQLVRSAARGLAEDIDGYIWYSLEDPGWRYVGLLDKNMNPRLAYAAYQQLAERLKNYQYGQRVVYAIGTDGYRFRNGSQIMDIIWAENDQVITIQTSPGWLVGAYDIYGKAVICQPDGSGGCNLPVGFSPLYIYRNP